LKKFDLTQRTGIVLAEFQKAELAVKVNSKNATVLLALKKAAPWSAIRGGGDEHPDDSPDTEREGGGKHYTVNKLRNKDSGGLFPFLSPSQQFDL
jgi:hypothetical protein